jgi:hypothetical protein
MGTSILPICYVTVTVISAATESIGTIGAHSSSRPPFSSFLAGIEVSGNLDKVFFSLA